MLSDFQSHVLKTFPFIKGKSLLLAVSGGLDSIVMAELFRLLEFNIEVAHCNFKLRQNESDDDEKYVKSYCENYQIRFHSISFDTEAYALDNKVSVQVAARQLRYMWFSELLQKFNLDFVLTAHHADDNLETIIINLSRGTGIDGLIGIPQQNGNILRPMLVFSREQIERFALDNDIKWREDSSNATDKYLRNKIRHGLIPLLKEINFEILTAVGKTSRNLEQTASMAADAAVLVYKQVVIEKPEKLIFKIYDLTRLPNYQAYLYYWLKDFGFTAWDDIYGLVHAQSGKFVLSPQYRLLKDREILLLEQRKPADQEKFYISKEICKIEHPVAMSFSEVPKIGVASNNCIFADAAKLKFPLTLRRPTTGDWFYPFGMTGRKNISKFLKDEKLSLSEKEDMWLLCSEDEVVWVVGKRMDNRFRVEAETNKILQIKLI